MDRLPHADCRPTLTSLGKMPPHVAVAVLNVGRRDPRPAPAEGLATTADYGMGRCLEACIMHGDEPVLRIEASNEFFTDDERAWFIRLTERIAARRRLKVI